jgi:hypothetical protein|tara:strand:- start:12379 stop:12666 length:288 start_codon:yes stop_codon:yes gene_type:complete
MDQGQLKELLEFQVNRNITRLYKSFLTIIEDIQDQHDNHFHKLKLALPNDTELINQADYLDESRMEFLRKQVLDQGNDVRREIVGQLEKFNLTIN